MTQSGRGRRIPVDSFRIRLAIVRTEMGWNYDQAEAATGISSESWRLWEKGQRHCSDVIGISKKIAQVTPYDQSWLALGGPLVEEVAQVPRRRPQTRARADAPIVRVRSPYSGEYMTSPRLGRCPVAPHQQFGRYRYRLAGNVAADVTHSVVS